MAVDLPADERTLQAAIMAAALVADPAAAANIAKLIEVEKLSAHPDEDVVPDDGSGAQKEAAPAHADPTPTGSAETPNEAAHSPGPETQPALLSDTAYHDTSLVAQTDNAPEASNSAEPVTPNEVSAGSLVDGGEGIAVSPATAPTHMAESTPSPDNDPSRPDSNHLDDLVRLPHTDDFIHLPDDHPATLLSNLTDSLNLKLVDHVIDTASSLVGGLIHDVAIDTQHLVGSALNAVGGIVDLLQSPILHNDGSIEVPSLHGMLHDSLDGLAAAVEGSPIPDLISHVLPPANQDHDPGIAPLIVDHVLDSLSHHLHLL
ncbi:MULTISPECIES: hypothetical protein [unclassified Beijerinckia]|uniref:hypothetical protein n=1 Tax=unclassified Beijerinckia TaxID=2638183 RepID=UPI000895E9E1|nr:MULTISPECIES: hypothetical protein [unclassified Beijerinckia]MDH7795977.1 hypothetical protein [Beijerinckia sp. GAS462]SEC24709.1 hypothetical protein SAMN05443249_2255 [Beijerinckia sp. 28-YEA-48]